MNLHHIDKRDAKLRDRLWNEIRLDKSHRPSKRPRCNRMDHQISMNFQYDLTDFSGLPSAPPVQTWTWIDLTQEFDLSYTKAQYATRPKWRPFTEAELEAKPPAYHAGNLLSTVFPPPDYTGPSKVVSIKITIGSDLLRTSK